MVNVAPKCLGEDRELDQGPYAKCTITGETSSFLSEIHLVLDSGYRPTSLHIRP